MRAKLLYALLGLQLFGLVLLYGYQQSGLGHPVYLLRTMPVDPRDLLRGDYIILGYEISRLPERYKDDELPEGRVYVLLKQDGDFWTIGEVLGWEPEDGTPFIQAERKGRRLIYANLDKYFVPEGKGNPPGKITVAISVRPDGSAQIKQLYQDGKPWP
jgi:uncharacterized membrane-anchored protein